MTGGSHVQAVLDPSGMVLFARGDSRVGEVIVEIAARDGLVGLPAVALLGAYTAVGADPAARARLGVLAVLPAVRVLPLAAAEAEAVAELAPGPPGDLARAHAAWSARVHNAYYVTADPPTAPGCLEAGQVYTVGAEAG